MSASNRLFSREFGIDPEQLRELGVFDPCLDKDSNLHVDPLLLSRSRHNRISRDAWRSWKSAFADIIIDLQEATSERDRAWFRAEKRLSFREVRETCLGYTEGSIEGRGMGPELKRSILKTAQAIVRAGVDDPELFLALPMFQPGVGADTISDMTTSLILADLLAFTEDIARRYKLTWRTVPGCRVLINPRTGVEHRVILVPRDILRELPFALNWNGILAAAAYNDNLRVRIATRIGDIWRSTTQEQKEAFHKKVQAHPRVVPDLIAIAKEASDRDASR